MEWKNKLKKLFLLLMPVFCVMTLAPVKKVEALSNSRLFMGVLLDTEREGVYIDVVEDKLVWKLDKWRRDDKKGYCGNGSMVGDSCAYLNYPGVKFTEEEGYTAVDEALATNAATIMTNSISEIVQACKAASPSGRLEGSADLQIIIKHLSDLTNDVAPESKLTVDCVGDAKIEIEAVPDDLKFNDTGVNMGTTKANFVRVRPVGGTDKDWNVVQWSVPKGYSAGQYGAAEWTSLNPSNETKNVEFISVPGISWYAVQAYTKNPAMVAGGVGYDELYDYNSMQKGIVNMISRLSSGLAKIIGIYSVDQLILNKGAVGYNYYYGIMPMKWMEVAKIFYWISTVVGLFILLYGYLISIGKISLSSISPSVRMSIKDTLLNYAIVLLLQALFLPVFNLAVNVNYWMVNSIATLAGNAGISVIGSSGVISAAIASIASLGINVAINIQYLLRALMVVLLFASAPIFISSIVIDPKRKMFSTWCRELFAYIFMQSFNALILAFLFMITY